MSEPPRLGGCHCGAVRFEVRLTGGFGAARRCDCSYCRMRGAVALTAKARDLTILRGAGELTSYRFNTRVAEHHFCRTCGIYTHHRRRSNPGEIGVNAACLDGVSPFDFAALPVNDGRHHPSDGGGGIAGMLRYEATEPLPSRLREGSGEGSAPEPA